MMTKIRLIACLLALVVLSTPQSQALAEDFPVGTQEYFVTGRETQVQDFFAAVQSVEGGSTIVDAMESVVPLTATADDQTIIAAKSSDDKVLSMDLNSIETFKWINIGGIESWTPCTP